MNHLGSALVVTAITAAVLVTYGIVWQIMMLIFGQWYGSAFTLGLAVVFIVLVLIDYLSERKP